jgi:hypothetical protein
MVQVLIQVVDVPIQDRRDAQNTNVVPADKDISAIVTTFVQARFNDDGNVPEGMGGS